MTLMIDLKEIVKDPRIEKVLTSLCASAISLSREISLSDTARNHRVLVGTNSDGDGQKQLDVIADDIFCNSLLIESTSPTR